MDTLNKEDVTALTRHFAPHEHEFRQTFAYITEEAITERLDEVDPAWSWTIINEWTRDNQAICTGRLTVKGVTREGVGMQPLTIVSKGETKEGTEPEKSAATDALKRAARLFGIGRYLLGLPDGTNNIQSLTNWLRQQGNGGSTQPTPRPTPPPATGQPLPANPQPSANGTHDDKPATAKSAAPVVKNDTKIEALDRVTIERFGKDGKRMVTSTGSYSYTREPFTAAGIDTELWTEPGLYMFGKPYNVISVWHQPKDPKAHAYWQVDRLEPMGKAEAELFGPAPVIQGDF